MHRQKELEIISDSRAVIHQCLMLLPIEKYPTDPCIIEVAQEIGYLEGQLNERIEKREVYLKDLEEVYTDDFDPKKER